EQVEADEHVGGAAGGPGRAGEGPVGDAHVADDRAALLRQAGLFQPGGVQAVEVGGHLQDLGDGDDAGAADAGHPDEDGAADLAVRFAGFDGQVGHPVLASGARLDQQERRAVALEAAQVGVAGRLVDAGLAAELGLDRLHGQAGGDVAAVAAALADALVHHDLGGGDGQLAALAQPPFLGGAAVVVDEHGDAVDPGQLPLGLLELVAVTNAGDAGQPDSPVRLRLGGGDDDPPYAFEGELVREGGHVEAALGALAAGHGDGVVVEELVRHRHAGGDGGADGERAGVVVGAVAEVLHEVAVVG